MTSTRRTAAAVFIAAALFGYIYFVESKKDPAAETSGDGTTRREKVFVGFDKLKVKSLTLKKPNGETVLAEKNGEAWRLVSPQETEADGAEISTLLDALQNLETEEIVSEATTDLAAFGLQEPKIRVSVVAEGAPKPFEFELGDAVPAGAGLFARIPSSPRLFTVASTLENTLNKTAFDLRNRNILKVKRETILSVEALDLDNNKAKGKPVFKLTRGAKGEDEWKIESPVLTRAARFPADSFLGLLENLRMESIVHEDATKAPDLSTYGLGASSRRVVLTLGEGKPVVLEIGKKTEEGKYYAREGSSTLVALIGSGLVDDLDKGLKNLRANRLLDVAAYEVSAFDVTMGGVTKTFTKATIKSADGADQVLWKSRAPVKDATQEKASEALFAIGSLEAAEFLDDDDADAKTLSSYGLEAPQLRVSLRFEGGKKEDWFEVTVKDDAGFARRRDDSSVLKLDKAKTEALIKNFSTLGS